MNNPSIGETIRTYRQIRNFTQEELGSSVGVSAQAVSKWECGESLPDTALIVSIANKLDISTDTLLGNEKICEYDLYQAIMKFIGNESTENRFRKAFDFTWIIDSGLGGGFARPPQYAMQLSETIKNDGFTLISLYKELPYFILFPEPENGFSSVLKPDKRYSELFEIFADNDTLNAFFYLFSKDAEYIFEKEILAEKCSISPDKIAYVIELLERYIIKGENVTVNDEVITLYSCKKHDQEFIVLFAVAKTILDYVHYGYNTVTNWRNKPYL